MDRQTTTVNLFIKRRCTRLLEPVVVFLHERLGLWPNQLTVLAFLFGLCSIVTIVFKVWWAALLLMAASVIFESLDGAMARRYSLETKRGYLLDTIGETILEFLCLAALVSIGEFPLALAFLAFFAILLARSLRSRSGFDPGLKRSFLFYGYFLGFRPVTNFVFLSNILSFVIQLLLIDYRVDIEDISREPF